jgi:hypothetical protein
MPKSPLTNRQTGAIGWHNSNLKVDLSLYADAVGTRPQIGDARDPGCMRAQEIHKGECCPILLKIMFTAGSRIPALITHVLDKPHFDPAGFHVGRAKMILGLLYKAKKERALALQHLSEAKRILSQFWANPDTCAGRYGSRGTGATSL